GAQSNADGELSLARGGSGKLQARNVGAGNEQDKDDRSHQEPRGVPKLIGDVLLEQCSCGAPTLACAWVSLLGALGESCHLSLCRGNADPGFQARHDAQAAVLAGPRQNALWRGEQPVTELVVVE